MAEFLAAILKIIAAVFADKLVEVFNRPQTAVTAEPPPEQDAVKRSIEEAIARGEAPPP